MKILHLTNSISEGGVESLLLQLLPELNKGNKCSLFVLSKNKMELKSRFNSLGIDVLENKLSSIYNPLVLLNLYKIARKNDIVHSHLFPTQYYMAVIKFLFWLTNVKTKFVTTEHCTTNRRRKPRFRWIEKIMYSAYQRIVGVSEASTYNLKEWIDDTNNKVITIHNGIDFQYMLDVVSYSKRSLGIPDCSIVLCMTARFFNQKDHETLIKALQFLPEYMFLLLIGSGEKEKGCIELSKSLGLQKRIKFLGHRSDVASIIKLADICILSTHYEGFPISILEYFSAGKPVIATNVDGVREMFDDYSLLSIPQDPNDLAAKIMHLYSNKQKLMLEEIKNRDKIKMYSLNRMAENYLLMYNSLVESEND